MHTFIGSLIIVACVILLITAEVLPIVLTNRSNNHTED